MAAPPQLTVSGRADHFKAFRRFHKKWHCGAGFGQKVPGQVLPFPKAQEFQRMMQCF